MSLVKRLQVALGIRKPGYPCKCGGKKPDAEYHTTVYCTDNGQQYLGIVDRHDPPHQSERWKGEELPLDD